VRGAALPGSGSALLSESGLHRAATDARRARGRRIPGADGARGHPDAPTGQDGSAEAPRRPVPQPADGRPRG